MPPYFRPFNKLVRYHRQVFLASCVSYIFSGKLLCMSFFISENCIASGKYDYYRLVIFISQNFEFFQLAGEGPDKNIQEKRK